MAIINEIIGLTLFHHGSVLIHAMLNPKLPFWSADTIFDRRFGSTFDRVMHWSGTQPSHDSMLAYHQLDPHEHILSIQVNMMTSSNGSVFRVTGPLCGEFTGHRSQRPVTRNFDAFFDLRLKKRLSKQSWGWWFETPSRSLWRHCNEIVVISIQKCISKGVCKKTVFVQTSMYYVKIIGCFVAP